MGSQLGRQILRGVPAHAGQIEAKEAHISRAAISSAFQLSQPPAPSVAAWAAQRGPGAAPGCPLATLKPDVDARSGAAVSVDERRARIESPPPDGRGSWMPSS